MKFSSYRDRDFCKCPSDFRSTFKCRWKYTAILRKVDGKMCSRQPRKVIWDMINTLFWTTVAVERLYFCCFPLALMNICPWPIVLFFQISLENSIQNHPQIIPIGIVACFFPTTFLETAVCPKMFWQPLSTYEAIKKVTILVCCDSQLRDKVIIKHLFAKLWRNWIEFLLLIIC